ncbi:MAG TPA: hypothetical protein PL151_18445 [Phycisphaerae bacterium]|nr:hypothetical protein [Phycisphaerae bacterium]HQE29737.1 hypothetical protein [Phycisphaerae bacterium]
MPDDKRAQAQELVARRFMQLAHKIDKPGRELIERLMEEQLAHQAGSGRPSSMPPAFGKEFAERILPIIPEIHEVARGIGQDVRPLLPLKQQLKMAGDLMAFKATVDGFEATMKKWASGEITSFQDPLGAHDQFEKDETGQTRTLQQARWRAQGEVENTRVKQWGTYIEQFKKLYDLDPAQAATADSILREFTQREERLMADPTWRDRIYEGQLWAVMSLALTGDWSHPARTLIEDQMALRRQSWDDLEAEFKARLESIPTTAQRRAAEEKIARLMQEKGLQLPEGQP